MKHLSELLNTEFGNSPTAKRAQVRNEILVRGDEILAELAKGWSASAIWKVLTKNKEIACSYKTFVAHVRRLQVKAPANVAATPKKEKNFAWNPTPNKEDLI
ncbi:MAG: hypothetical protein JO334_15065 [Verrucomicrobia bacterium]|nr:hypothetical protein [Verrucomicrobiota bacterium]